MYSFFGVKFWFCILKLFLVKNETKKCFQNLPCFPTISATCSELGTLMISIVFCDFFGGPRTDKSSMAFAWFKFVPGPPSPSEWSSSANFIARALEFDESSSDLQKIYIWKKSKKNFEKKNHTFYRNNENSLKKVKI